MKWFVALALKAHRPAPSISATASSSNPLDSIALDQLAAVVWYHCVRSMLHILALDKEAGPRLLASSIQKSGLPPTTASA